MPTVISSRTNTLESDNSIRIKYYPKVHYIRLLVFFLFIYFSVVKELWFFTVFAALLILLTFKGKMIILNKYNDELKVFYYLSFLRFLDHRFDKKSSLAVVVSRYKPWGIIWESKSAYAYKLTLSYNTTDIFLCHDNKKHKLEEMRKSLNTIINNGHYNKIL